LLNEGRHRWRLELQAPDLAQLPQPKEMPFVSRLKGALRLEAEMVKESAVKPWRVDAHVQADKISGELAWDNSPSKIRGPFTLNFQGRANVEGAGLQIPQFSLDVNLSGAHVEYAGLLNKGAGVPLTLSVSGEGHEQAFQWRQAKAQLWQLNLVSSGSVALRAPYPAKIHLEVAPTHLEGLEKILPPLKAMPVQGDVALNMDVDGPLAQTELLNIQVGQLLLRNFYAQVDFNQEGLFKGKGPIRANLEAQGEMRSGRVRRAKAQGFISLRDMAGVIGPLRKEGRQELQAHFQVGNADDNLRIDSLKLQTFFGNMELSGVVKNPARPELNLRVQAAPVNLSELRMALPEWREKIPKGQMRGQLNLIGSTDASKPWQDWPMQVRGDLQVQLPEFVVAETPAESSAKLDKKGANEAVPPEPPLEPFLPRGQLTSQANLKLGVQIGELRKGDLVAKGLRVNGVCQRGTFMGDVQVAQIFSGAIDAKGLEVPLIETQQKIHGQVQWRQIRIEEALGFASPEYKTMAKGLVSGQAQLASFLPAHPQFKTALGLRGDFKAQPVTVNSVKLGESINDLIKKAPMLKLTPVKVDPLQGLIEGQFDLQAGIINLPRLLAQDESGSELHLTGKVKMATLDGDLVGTFLWANPQVKGCFLEGNADGQGRMVVPISLKGNLMKPELSTLSDLVAKLGKKTLECEAKKLIQGDGKVKLKKELDKALKGLLGK